MFKKLIELQSRNIRVEVTDSNNKYASDSVDFKVLDAGLISDVIPKIIEECLKEADTPYVRAKWLHDYLVNHAEYDYSYTQCYPHGVLVIGKGVCNSYATAYKLLLDEIGISNKLITGEANNSAGKGWEKHAWNQISIDDAWYHVDVTWAYGWGYKYFLKSDQEMSKDHRWEIDKYPACTTVYEEDPIIETEVGSTNQDGEYQVADLL